PPPPPPAAPAQPPPQPEPPAPVGARPSVWLVRRSGSSVGLARPSVGLVRRSGSAWAAAAAAGGPARGGRGWCVPHRPVSFVDAAVMFAAQQHQVLQGRAAAIGPVLDVMSVCPLWTPVASGVGTAAA